LTDETNSSQTSSYKSSENENENENEKEGGVMSRYARLRVADATCSFAAASGRQQLSAGSSS
jgi:hypothetical protein